MARHGQDKNLPPILDVTQTPTIKNRWLVVKKIGQGAFGEIYMAEDMVSKDKVAIKTERLESKKQVIKLEVAVLRKLQDCPYVPRFIACGHTETYNYLVMELLGDNLSEVRRRQPGGRFPVATACKLGNQTLRAIEAMHERGYIHRDIKPSNVCLPPADSRGSGKSPKLAYLVDFGLARKYVDIDGRCLEPRSNSGFRGTARYASLNSHLSKDLGRLDDLWSLFYVIVEFVAGCLPWRSFNEKDDIRAAKSLFFEQASAAAEQGESRSEDALPTVSFSSGNSGTLALSVMRNPEMIAFMKHLSSLSFDSTPDYGHLRLLLNKFALRSRVGPEQSLRVNYRGAVGPVWLKDREIVRGRSSRSKQWPRKGFEKGAHILQDQKEKGELGKGEEKDKQAEEKKDPLVPFSLTRNDGANLENFPKAETVEPQLENTVEILTKGASVEKDANGKNKLVVADELEGITPKDTAENIRVSEQKASGVPVITTVEQASPILVPVSPVAPGGDKLTVRKTLRPQKSAPGRSPNSVERKGNDALIASTSGSSSLAASKSNISGGGDKYPIAPGSAARSISPNVTGDRDLPSTQSFEKDKGRGSAAAAAVMLGLEAMVAGAGFRSKEKDQTMIARADDNGNPPPRSNSLSVTQNASFHRVAPSKLSRSFRRSLRLHSMTPVVEVTPANGISTGSAAVLGQSSRPAVNVTTLPHSSTGNLENAIPVNNNNGLHHGVSEGQMNRVEPRSSVDSAKILDHLGGQLASQRAQSVAGMIYGLSGLGLNLSPSGSGSVKDADISDKKAAREAEEPWEGEMGGHADNMSTRGGGVSSVAHSPPNSRRGSGLVMLGSVASGLGAQVFADSVNSFVGLESADNSMVYADSGFRQSDLQILDKGKEPSNFEPRPPDLPPSPSAKTNPSSRFRLLKYHTENRLALPPSYNRSKSAGDLEAQNSEEGSPKSNDGNKDDGKESQRDSIQLEKPESSGEKKYAKAGSTDLGASGGGSVESGASSLQLQGESMPKFNRSRSDVPQNLRVWPQRSNSEKAVLKDKLEDGNVVVRRSIDSHPERRGLRKTRKRDEKCIIS